jgi:protein TonB
MNNAAIVDQLDAALNALLAEPEATPQVVNLEIGTLLGIAAELRILPSSEFKAQLKADLLKRAGLGIVVPIDSRLEPVTAKLATKNRDESQMVFLPTLLGNGYGGYPMQRRSFAASFLAQAAAIALFLGAGMWMARDHAFPQAQKVTFLVVPDTYVPPPAKTESGGGGGGGDRDKVRASKGVLPRAAQEQITPLMVVARNQNPKLTAPSTVVMPPNITFPQAGELGNPLSSVLLPSNGTGSGGGIGSGIGEGVGSGTGPGVGPGTGGGIGGGIFRVGGGVSAPRAIYDPEPEYSEGARKAKFQGAVVLSAVIGPDGRPRDIRVARSLGMGLDEQAMAAVHNWRFEPALKDGQPVAVLVNIEVDFRLY